MLGWFYLVSAPLSSRAQCRVELPGPADAGRAAILLAGPGLQQQARARLVTEWADRLPSDRGVAKVDVRRVPGMDTMLDIVVDAGDGDYAVEFIRELLARREERCVRDAAEAQARATARLNSERDSLRSQFDDARAELQAFRCRGNARYAEARAEAERAFLSQVARREVEVLMEWVTLDAWNAILTEAPGGSAGSLRDRNTGTTAVDGKEPDWERQEALLDAAFPETDPDGAELAVNSPALLRQVRDWRMKRRALEQCQAAYSARLAAHGPDSPDLADPLLQLATADKDAATAERRMMAQLRARIEVVQLQLGALEKAAQRPADGVLNTSQQAAYELLEITVEHLRSRYQRCQTDILEARLGGGGDDSTFMRMVEPPVLAGRTPLPWTRAYAPLVGLVVGAVIGGLVLCGWRRRSRRGDACAAHP